MSVFEIMAAGAYPIVGLAGFILGSLFGQKLVADVEAALKAIEGRLSSVESSVATSKATVAIEHHAAATEKLAAAVSKHSASPASPAPKV
jgi:copper chaperone CopZ